MSDYSQFAQANPGTDYPVKDAQLRAQLSLDSDKVDSGAVGHAFGYKRNTTAGLNVGYYGGVINVAGTLTTIADGTIALTASQTNYVERTAAGVVSKNTAGFTAGKIPMFTAVTDTTDVTAVVDKRQRNVFGDFASVGVAFFADGTAGAPGIAFTSDPDSGLYRVGPNNLGIAVNGVEVLDISSAGIAVDGDIYTAPWTDYSATSTVTGFSGSPSKTIWTKKVGKMVFVWFQISGTSNATTVTFTLPYAISMAATTRMTGGQTTDNGVGVASCGISIPASGATITVFKDIITNSFTPSGDKVVSGQFWYMTN